MTEKSKMLSSAEKWLEPEIVMGNKRDSDRQNHISSLICRIQRITKVKKVEREVLRKRKRTSVEERKAAGPGNERGKYTKVILCLHGTLKCQQKETKVGRLWIGM